MPKYLVTVRETVYRDYIVEAESRRDALVIAEDRYADGDGGTVEGSEYNAYLQHEMEE